MPETPSGDARPTPYTIDAARDALKHATRRFLRQEGWHNTNQTPDGRLMWRKQDRGLTLLVSEDDALEIALSLFDFSTVPVQPASRALETPDGK